MKLVRTDSQSGIDGNFEELANTLELYLYCELRFPPPEDYCPKCLNRIIELMESRESPEDFRCC